MSIVHSMRSRKGTPHTKGDRIAMMAILVGSAALMWTGIATAADQSNSRSAFLTSLGTPTMVGSTVPANGDVNPYGIVVVPSTAGKLTQGDTLISNFNDKANVQGTGTTIVEVSPSGTTSTFATISSFPASTPSLSPVGFPPALSILA